ncbi:hypothetical protein [Arenibacter sp. F20364]|uniref:hypothetical protein n=1 Tax=Arenibacter sp. F20364 TaxID=2926415 RepID=UPI001FF5D1FF|nr:hypothetical protein [Arenibacter sp. F20364]MCK0189585.1 hypothetical protein [Arenibacter sp. F20364]
MKFIFFLLSMMLVRAQDKGGQLAAWEEGMLDIHHINTGRGDAAFFVFPDATTLLVDAGDMSETHPRTLSARNAVQKPDNSRTAPEWIVDYIHQFFPKNRSIQLDYGLITHFHDDHFGEMDGNRKRHPKGNYALTGIMEVGSLLPIKSHLDRGCDYPIDLKNPQVQKEIKANDSYSMIETLQEYWKYMDYHTKVDGMTYETLKPGAINQIKLKNSPDNFPNFSVRNIAVNGNVWTGENEDYFSLFSNGVYPGENPLSTCIKITFGEFDYFAGGDISGVDAFGQTNFNGLESHVAPVIGPVDIATLNHYGNRDSQNIFFVRTLKPRVWIQQNWSSDHPGEEVLRRITSKELYPGERDIFSTVMLQPTKDVIGNRLDQYKSQNGHIVVRVYDKGRQYGIYILNDDSEEREIIAKYGPYEAR